MLSINDLKVGTNFILDSDVHVVLYTEHSKIARGGAMLRTKIKNLAIGAIIEKTFKGSEKFKEAKLERKDCQYLYKDGNDFFFMNNETYEQFSVGKKMLGKAANFIKEGENIKVLYFKNKPLAITLPPKVKLIVAHAEKGLKGNTVSATTKPVTLETGYVLRAPLFIKEGDTILVNTETGEYVERI